MLPTTFTPTPRIHHALTANLERRLLTRLAHHTPHRITADHLTLLGLFAQLAAGASYALTRTHRPALLLVNLFITLNWLGDSLDGTLARTRHLERPRYGFYVDHATDLLGATALMTGLAASGLCHPIVGLAMLLAFLLLSAESFLATHTLARFHMSTGPFGPTELRLLLITGNLFLLRSPYAHIAGHTFLLFDLGGTIATTCMLLTFLTLTLRHTAELHQAEPLPTPRNVHPTTPPIEACPTTPVISTPTQSAHPTPVISTAAQSAHPTPVISTGAQSAHTTPVISTGAQSAHPTPVISTGAQSAHPTPVISTGAQSA